MRLLWLKNNLTKYVLLTGICGFLYGCIDQIDLNIPEQKQLLIIDGLITDQPGPYKVNLSLSSDLDQLEANPVSQAIVKIEEENGVQVNLTEINPGEYLTDSSSIRGKVGKRYRLEVSLKPGRTYRSDWVLLKPAPAVGDIYYEFGPIPNSDIFVQGIQIFVDTRDPENKTQFYRWEWEDTWMHIAPFATGLEFLGNDTAAQGPVYNICYNHSKSNSIYIASSVNNTEDVISRFPIHIVSGFGSQLRTKYSILVKQYALTEEEFLFWNRVQEANEESGTLYDRQPQSTVGNMFRVEDDREPVLGYFSVSGYSEKRLFISRDELPDDAIIGEQYIQNCIIKADTLPKGLASEGDVWDALSSGRVFFNFLRDPDIVGWILVTTDCADCREAGGTLEEPDFWE